MFQIGTTLTLEYKEDEHELMNYRCRIVEFNEDTIYIDYPIHTTTSRTDFFPNGTVLIAYFVGSDHAVYQFKTVVKGRKKNNIPMLLLHFDQSKLIRVQRREYVRVSAQLDISLTHPDNLFETLTTITTNISGGGMAVIIPEDHPIKPGMVLESVMVLPSHKRDQYYLHTNVEAVRIQPQKPDPQTSLLSLKFTNINEREREQIIQYCFDKQRKLRQKL